MKTIIAALEHPDRVRYLGLDLTCFQLEKMVMVMQAPFPVLTSLLISCHTTGYKPALPDDFLGGSAPCLQEVHFTGIPFPALPTLLLSASDLVTLILYDIPSNGYFSPEAMIAALAGLPMLQNLIINFKFANTQLDPTHLPPPTTRVVLPALTSFDFQGTNEYLEVLVTRIVGAQLSRIWIAYLDHSLDFPVAQFSKFFHRSVSPDISPFTLARFYFCFDSLTFSMFRHGSNHLSPDFSLACVCEHVTWRQVSQMAQAISQFSSISSTVVHLNLDVAYAEYREFEGTGGEWLHFFSQFSMVRALHVSWRFAGHVALAMEYITEEMVAEVWPSLDSICLGGHLTSSVKKFIAARQLSGHPVTVCTEIEFIQRVRSYVRDS